MPVSPPLPAHALLVFLLQLAVLLLLALCLGRLATRLGMPSIVGELLTGVLLGPSLLGHLAPGFTGWLLPVAPSQAHLLDGVGQLGVLLLVGIAGAQMDTRLLRRRAPTAARVSLAGLVIPLGLGIGLGFLLPVSLRAGGGSLVFALFLGVAMCVTALPVIVKTLTDMNLLHREIGQLTIAAGMVDDAVGWLLLSVVSAMATTGLRADRVALSVFILIAFVLLMLLVIRHAVRPLLRLTSRVDDPGPTVALTVVVILLSAAATHALGMDPIFGAFLAGLVIGPAQARRLAALRVVVLGVLAPIFLASAGLRMDLTALAVPGVALAAVIVLAVAILGKFAGAYLGARGSGLNAWEGLALGAGMNSRGVVEVVVAMAGLRLGILNAATYTIILLVAVITSVMAPPLLRLAMNRVEHTADERLREREQHSWTLPAAERRHDGGL
ncbi:Kef-type K+ transport system membrane component KefB [Kibdelosporangium banguiense]|uniref:Kef-type K+ transport system membrane component KefB n=1 Tax=Kibdelosporangium banguiense TaxID=1365924 RepID=A0ABS4TSA2_9PSEU|nr:cation:proton antiporter [Kibdelosporangium banguiense]MBP2327271.1 Kef-type K+ transport system membrane component KefB [Kibdelosporangium banguiense]